MWKIEESHKWVMCPYTSYEMRRELRVRESRHTAMIFDRKYYDVETGKYISDKLQTLYSASLSDMMEPEQDNTSLYLDIPRGLRARKRREENWNRKKFVPKDDDFDD